MPLRERGHPDVEVAQPSDDADEFLGVLDALGVFVPLPQGIPGRVAAQHEQIADPGVDIRAHDRAQFGGAVPDGGELRHREQGGLGGQQARHPGGAVGVEPPAP